MGNIVVTLTLFLGIISSNSQPLAGLWNTGKENTIVEISEENGEFLGKIKSSDNEKAIAGNVILKDLLKTNDGWRGRLFVPKRQKWLDVKIAPSEARLDLVVSAGFIEKEVQWLRVKN